MSNGFIKFLGVLLLLGSIGFVTVKSVFTGGFRFMAQTATETMHAAADQR